MKFSLSLGGRTFGLFDYLFWLAITVCLMLMHPALPDLGYIKRDPFAIAPLFFQMVLAAFGLMCLGTLLAEGLLALKRKARQGASSPPTSAMPNSVTMEGIESKIKKCEFYVWPGTTLTICLLTLENGTVIPGYSACADPANFDRAKGEKYSRDDAIRGIWPREGYLLRERLFGTK